MRTAMLSMLLVMAGAKAQISCSARVALNRVFFASVNEVTRDMRVMSDAGAVWEGNASLYTSSSGRIRTFHIPLFDPYPGSTSYPTGMALEIDSMSSEMALCLRSGECYLCR